MTIPSWPGRISSSTQSDHPEEEEEEEKRMTEEVAAALLAADYSDSAVQGRLLHCTALFALLRR